VKKSFYLGAFALILFEVANVYFIMPLKGSQEITSIGLAYLLHSHRFLFRALFILLIILGLKDSWKSSKILVLLMLASACTVFYFMNFKMAADHMFYQPKKLTLLPASENKVGLEKIIIGIADHNEAKAYPIQFIGFHHQVHDSIAGKPILVTYCTVCRSGRIFSPVVNGKLETFRLVGMDHYNAMFEDKTSNSWWRQETGEAVEGPLKGQSLNELPSAQATLGSWLSLHPNSLIMQADSSFQEEYDSLANYESGKRKGRLTRRDTSSWHDKSWVAGIVIDHETKAYDWNQLTEKRIINDTIKKQSIVLFITQDDKGLFAFRRKNEIQLFSIRNDTLSDGKSLYNLLGYSLNDSISKLEPLQAYQEYWHSWRFFHPGTLRDE
jgi:hypothetical protein